VFRLFRPHYYVASVLELSAAHLTALGIEGLLLDLDGTLKNYDAEEVPGVVREWMDELQAAGIRLCLLSNGRRRRIERIANILGVPFVAKAFKPMPFRCRRGVRLLGLERSRVAVIGDQVFADVLAGRLAGLRTILVPPMHRIADEPWFTRVKRPLERWVLSGMRAEKPKRHVVVVADEANQPGQECGSYQQVEELLK
jgi:HAD superfamily phosphatase (TIGR01668 family)